MAKEPRLAGKVALIFGAGAVTPGWSIGKATSVLFARHGARVAAADISEASLADTVSRIDALGDRALPLIADVCDTSQIDVAVEQAMAHFGRIDILVNNVGLGRTGPLTEVDDAEWDRIAAANLRGPLAACRATIPHMIAGGGGSIISTSSVAALRYIGYPHHAYSATKAGLIQLMRTIALEHAPAGIRANTIVPGLIDTPRVARNVGAQFSKDAEEVRRKRGAQVPLGHMGTADDIAEAMLFLASDAARYVTATELVVDGGLIARYGSASGLTRSRSVPVSRAARPAFSVGLSPRPSLFASPPLDQAKRLTRLISCD